MEQRLEVPTHKKWSSQESALLIFFFLKISHSHPYWGEFPGICSLYRSGKSYGRLSPMCWSQRKFGKGRGISQHIIWDKDQSLLIWIPELSAVVCWHLVSIRDIYQRYTVYITLSSRGQMTRCKDIRILIIIQRKKFVVLKEEWNEKSTEIVFQDAWTLSQFKHSTKCAFIYR